MTKSILFATARHFPAYTRLGDPVGNDVSLVSGYLGQKLYLDQAPGEMGVESGEGEQTLGRQIRNGIRAVGRGRMEGVHSSPGNRREMD